MSKLNKYNNPHISIIRQKGRYKLMQMTLFLLLCSSLLFMCKKDRVIELNAEYGPTREMQFGEESALVQELSFNSNGFSVVGDLLTPVDGENHPVIIMIHGSGAATRNGAVPFEPLIEIFLRNGYAVLSWDKPGSGESKGEFSNEFRITERAKIIIDAIKVMIDNPSVDNSNIGLWGISEAGWVMPKALNMTDDIAFMIVVSGGGEDSIDQFAYQVGQVAACAGESPETAEDVEMYWSQMAKATTYSEYKEAADYLVSIPSVVDYTGIIVSQEEQWNAWPIDIDAFFNPIDIIKQTTLPVLAFFGSLDKNIDPVQGAVAYENALAEAGNEDHYTVVIEGAGHVLAPVETGCLDEFVGNEYVPEFLDLLETWLSER